MRLSVFCGDDDDAIRARFARALADAQPADREDVDCAADGGAGLVLAVSSPSLFGPVRLVAVENVGVIALGELGRLEQVAVASDAVVVARHPGTIPAAVRKRLAALGQVATLSVPKGKGVGIRVDEIAAREGIRVGAAVRRLLVERAGHDLDRVASVMAACRLGGLTTPTERQVAVLLGSAAAPGVPWALTDALEHGDVAAALRAAARVTPIAALAYLSSQVDQAARLLDAGVTDTAAAAELLGVKHTFQADKALALARRLGHDGTAAAWRVLLDAQLTVRSPAGERVALDAALVRLAPLFRR